MVLSGSEAKENEMTNGARFATLLTTLIGIPAHGARQEIPVLRALIDCVEERDGARRLACYEEKVAALTKAQNAGDVIITDRERIREAELRTLGLRTERAPGGRSDPLMEITAKIQSVRPFGYGKWMFTLDNGMRWRQVDDERIYPKAGQAVTLRAASMGGYTMKVGSSLIRVSRIG